MDVILISRNPEKLQDVANEIGTVFKFKNKSKYMYLTF